MKGILTIVIATLFIPLSAKGQNLLFMGEQSYPSTETYTLHSNSFGAGDLNVIFAKDGNTALFAVSRTSIDELVISGKLIIYLDDGKVITLKDKGTDYVDKTSKAVYYLTDEGLNKMKNSNINTVRYTLERGDGPPSTNTGNYTASNKGDSKIDFPAVVSEFFGTKRSENQSKL